MDDVMRFENIKEKPILTVFISDKIDFLTSKRIQIVCLAYGIRLKLKKNARFNFTVKKSLNNTVLAQQALQALEMIYKGFKMLESLSPDGK